MPGDPKHVMYVWVDALTNYITGDGLSRRGRAARASTGRPNVHIIGKDIVRFHAVYWPAFLMSAGIALPKRVFGHGFLFNRGEKMSKSVGNVIDPFTLVEHYGVDQVRYFFLREVPFGQDGNYTHEAIVNRINADLANDLGNLAQRSLSMIAKNCGGVVPSPGDLLPSDTALLGLADNLVWQARNAMDDFALHTCSPRSGAWWRKPIAISRPRSLGAEEDRSGAHGDGALRRPPRSCGRSRSWPSPSRPGRRRRAARPAGGAARTRAISAMSAPTAACRPTRLPAPKGVFPRYVEAARSPAAEPRLTSLVDSHCHLDFPDFAAEREAIVARASAAGIGRMVTISTRVRRFERHPGALTARYDDVFARSARIRTMPPRSTTSRSRRSSASPPSDKVVAIGEAGLDYHYDFSPRDAQARGFRNHIAAARADRPAAGHPCARCR